MDYNPRSSMFNARTSMARSSSQFQRQQQQPRKEDDGNAFMTLPDKEIAGCICDIGFNFTVDDLRKPNPQQVQKLFEWFLVILTGTTREVVAPAMHEAAIEHCGEDMADRVFPPEARELAGFFVTLRTVLSECGVKDFSTSDVYRPTHGRLVKTFSYLINFIRFREGLTDILDAQYAASGKTKADIEWLSQENQYNEETLRELQENRKNVEKTLKEKEQRSMELKTRLLELKKVQEGVSEKLEQIKGEQNRLKHLLEQKTMAILNQKAEANRIRPYTEQSPAKLEESLQELGSLLTREREEIDQMEKRTRDLQLSLDSFTSVHTDISHLLTLLEQIQSEQAKEKQEAHVGARNREALAEKINNVRELERQEKLTRKQLEQLQKRTEKIRSDTEAKSAAAKERMEELRKEHRELIEQRRGRGEEVERRRIRIEQTEKKVWS
ncbi:Nuf2 like protein [Piedraia hortae CBS 480.64]|uniref:Probable kinetochore protein NUF2 n=1 Tax=Piedraia hortae CBS 480.64 TaxID=1314780 RepID=A0A6A7BR40_9PEZI|nr:Nuf2 like protein [Piedraia hortae CBS 480.64]